MCKQHLWLLAVVTTLTLRLSGAARAASPVATVHAVSGTLTVRRQSATAFAPLPIHGALYVGDVARTGANSKATLLFGDGSTVGLNANSTAEITAPSSVGKGKQSLVSALSGEVLARVRPGKAVQTRSAVAGVRGTAFHLRVEEDGTTTLTVLEGEVDFFNPHGAVVVGESQQSVARPDAAPTAPVTVQNAGLIIEWTLDLDRAIIPREKFFITPDRQGLEGELQSCDGRVKSQPNDADAHADYGDALFDSGKYEDALREYQEANRLAPNQPATLTRIGDTLLELGRVEEAEGSYRAALGTGVSSPPKSNLGSTKTKPAESRLFPNQQALSLLRFVVTEFDSVGEPADGDVAPALIGLAWAALTRNRPAEAQKMAEQALAVTTVGREFPFRLVRWSAEKDFSPYDSEVHIALGLSFMRQPGKLNEATQAFHAALNAEPQAYHYQARAWLALVHLAQNHSADALKEAQAAVQLAPQSALARGNLALVCFHSGKARDAEREARLATQLNPDSVAARVALGQTLLAVGNVDAATQAAAQAVALDPKLPQARYLLGVADAQRRDYRHAARELREALRLAPDFVPAASVLARVYVRIGRTQEAVTLLTELQRRHPQSDEVTAALGGVHYEQGRYDDAVAHYEQALKLRPNSALYHAELARTLLDANRLNEAIIAGQQAVRLAPEVGQYHAVLGLAYEFSRLSLQAEREFRQAIALDPRNALAHLVLGLKAAQADPRETRIFPKQTQSLGDLLKQGLQAVSSSPAVSSIAQAFLYDPAISTQVLRGGIGSEVTLNGGNDTALNPSATHRSIGVGGMFHSIGLVSRERDQGSRLNDDTTQTGFSENLTFITDPRTSLFARVSHLRTKQGLPGLASLPDLDDRADSRNNLSQLAVRRRLGMGNYLWVGLSRPTARLEITNPDHDSQLMVQTPVPGNAVTMDGLRQELNFGLVVPELRLEFALNREPARPTILTFGAARTHLEPTVTADLFFPSAPPNPPVIARLGTHLDGRLSVAYAQLTQRVNDRLSFAAQLRQQSLKTTRTEEVLGGGSVSFSEEQSRWLPSLLVNYRTDERTLLRLFFNRQAQEQELTVLAFRPTETLLATEPLVMPKGFPSRTETVELDIERYLSPKDFLKLFLFRTTAEGVTFGDLPPMSRIERTGVGLRYERQLNRNLYAQVGYLYNRTTNRTPFAPFDEGTAPYHAPRLAGLALNYVDRAGTKIGLQLNYTGEFFQDTGDLSATERPIFPARTYVDLTLAKEPSLRTEFFIRVTNLFNARAIQFNDFPTGARRLVGGVTVRF